MHYLSIPARHHSSLEVIDYFFYILCFISFLNYRIFPYYVKLIIDSLFNVLPMYSVIRKFFY